MKRSLDNEFLINYFLKVDQLYEGLVGTGIKGVKSLAKAKQIPLAGIETPAEIATKLNNLKQYQRYIWDKVKTYPSIGGSLKPREVPMNNGNTLYIFARDRYKPGEKPLATMLLNKSKQVIGKDFSRITPQEQEFINTWANNNIVGNAKPFVPSVPMGALVHERAHHHSAEKALKADDFDKLFNYTGNNSQASQILARAHQVSGNSARNDLEALTIYIGHLGKISQRNSDLVKRDHEILKQDHDTITRLQADIDAKEKRFQDFNKRVSKAQDLSVQQQASMAQQMAQTPVSPNPDATKNSQIVKRSYQEPSQDYATQTARPQNLNPVDTVPQPQFRRQPSNSAKYQQVAEGKMKAIYTVMKDLYGAMDDMAFKKMYGVTRDAMKQNLEKSVGRLPPPTEPMRQLSALKGPPKPGQLPPTPSIPGPKPVELRGQTPGERPEWRQFFTRKFNSQQEAEAWASRQNLHDYYIVEL